jgi:hypothetical protein
MTSIRKHVFKFVDHDDKKIVSICLHFICKYPKEVMEIDFNDKAGYDMWVKMMGEVDFGQREAAATILRDYFKTANSFIKIDKDEKKLNYFPKYRFIKEKTVCKSKMWNLNPNGYPIKIDGGIMDDKICQIYAKGHIDKISDLQKLTDYKHEHFDETFQINGKFPNYTFTIRNEHRLFPSLPNGTSGEFNLSALRPAGTAGRSVNTSDTVDRAAEELAFVQIPVNQSGTLSTNPNALKGGYRHKGDKNKHHKRSQRGTDWTEGEDDMWEEEMRGGARRKKKSSHQDDTWEDEDWGMEGGDHTRGHGRYGHLSKAELERELEDRDNYHMSKARKYGDAAHRARGNQGWN